MVFVYTIRFTFLLTRVCRMVTVPVCVRVYGSFVLFLELLLFFFTANLIFTS